MAKAGWREKQVRAAKSSAKNCQQPRIKAYRLNFGMMISNLQRSNPKIAISFCYLTK
jgi:hypothetical protein